MRTPCVRIWCISAGFLEFVTNIAAQVMSVARTLVGQEEAALDAGAGSPQEAKARELGLDPLFSPEQRPHTAAAFAAAPRFILLDFRSAAPAAAMASVLLQRSPRQAAQPLK